MSVPKPGIALSLLVAGLIAAPEAQVNVKIDFEPAAAVTPAGYVKEAGAAYSEGAGRGFVTQASLSAATHIPVDIQANTRDRNASGVEARLNTLIHLQYSGSQGNATPSAYEYAVPNGLYKVVVSVGDAGFYNSNHYVNVEGVSVISNFVGAAGNAFKADSTVVQVADGRITVDAVGGSNTKLNYIHILSDGTPPVEPVPIDLKVNFQTPAGAPPAGYLKDYGQPYGLRTGTDQGSGLSYGWVAPGTANPVNLSVGGNVPGNGRDRGIPASDRRLATLMHMQANGAPTSFQGTRLAGAWEIAVPNGYYNVAVSVGDASYFDGVHRIAVEGQVAIAGFTPSAVNHFFAATAVVQVADGRLTLDATGGVNTKINYVTLRNGISAAGRPSIGSVSPAMAAVGAPRDGAINAEVNLVAGPINAATVTAANAQLFRSDDNFLVPAQVNTSGGGDVVVIQPSQPLDATKGYRYEIGQGLQDVSGNPFLPASGHFTTGTALAGSSAQIFDPVSLGTGASGYSFTTLAIGPGTMLYAGTLTGEILRFPINTDGTLGARQIITSVITSNGGVAQAIIGMVFDPAATAANPILWITANDRNIENALDWSGKITRLSGANLATVANYVVGLPRATKDHMSNSLAFGPDGALYLSQGSRSATGAYEETWKGDEHLLSAAILRIQPAAITAPPLDVKTEAGGSYNPFASGAPVTIYASGIRNAYDLVWHSNGSLYASGNGSAAGGNTPATPSPLPAACADRIDKGVFGAYTGPSVPAIIATANAQSDLLYRVEAGKYYGHPNPKRCEWVLNGGNPTSGTDVLQETQYPVGTQPDRNWQQPAFDYGQHFSPNGIIEYRNNRFSGALQAKMMACRYSGGNDILVMTVDPATKKISSSEVLNTNGVKFADPLDLVENTANGYLYLAEYSGKKITLLKPR